MKWLFLYSEADYESFLLSMATYSTVDGRRNWECTHCGYGALRKSDVRKHIERRHVNKAVVCSACEKSFPNLFDYNRHCQFECNDIDSKTN